MPLETELVLLPSEIADSELIRKRVLSRLKLKPADMLNALVYKRRSIDARSKQPVFKLLVQAFINEIPVSVEPVSSNYKDVSGSKAVIIVGAGPAGYFAALELIEQGLKPIVLERGKDARARRRDLKAIQQDGIVNPHSNYCFGEGGAGTYSDGKLYTRSKKRGSIEKTLRILVDHGANPDIMVDAHPHIGSNKLPVVVQAIRESILKFGGEIHFDAFVNDLIIDNSKQERKIIGVRVNATTEYFGEAVILATGHSARDIFELLDRHKIRIEAKPFALGVRIEHPQELIDEIQYHQRHRHQNLPASSYSLVCQVQNRGVFSFCMCPGGLIVPASTSPGELVVNGMSMSRRDSAFANSGLVVAVELEDLKAFANRGEFAALEFQKSVEVSMFNAGDGSQKAPAQRITDFVKGKLSSELPKTSYIPGVFSERLDKILPEGIKSRLQVGLQQFGKQMKGYYSAEAQIVGTESRTSSPVRIPRDSESLMHPEISGLFPCGEGAGFAGGIMSAAMDGMNVAEKIRILIQ
jgi:uncharacterized FAD-dependent dehydrogenase